MDSSPTPHKEKKGLGRLWAKVKSAIRSKSKKDTKTPSTAPNTQSLVEPQSTQRYFAAILDPVETTNTTSNLPSRTVTSVPQTIPVPEESVPTTAQPTVTPTMSVPQPVEVTPASVDQENDTTKAHSTQPVAEVVMSPGEKEEMARRIERAQAIFKKYNIDFDEIGWDVPPKAQGERIFKAPRIRVRWTCHECKTTFGHDKICVECAHPRCKSCERYPPRKKKARAAKKAAVAAAMAGASTEEVHEGACHECQTTFEIGTIECSNCHHQICERCLQETLSTAERGEGQTTTAS